MSKVLREMIVKISADSTTYRSEMARAARLGDDYFKVVERGSRRANSAVRQNQAALHQLQAQYSTMKASAAQFMSVYTGGFSVGSILKMADDYGQMATRIKTALKSIEGDASAYEDVQVRLLEISNRNASAIEANQQLYLDSAAAMSNLGYSTNETIDFIESLSNSFAANGTPIEKVQASVNALNKSMASGNISAEDWKTLMSSMPNVVSVLAQELGKTETEIKELGLSAHISMKEFAAAMIEGKDIGKQTNEMGYTINQGFVQVTNSLKSYLGEANQASGTTRVAASALQVLSANIDLVVTAWMGLKGLGLIRYFGQMGQSVAVLAQQQWESVRSSLQTATAHRDIANASLQRYGVEKRALLVQKENIIQAQVVTQSYRAQISLNRQLAVVESQLTAVREKEAIATRALSAANAQLNVTSNLAKRAGAGLLNLLGGPVGLAFTVLAAASSFLFFKDSMKETKGAIIDLNVPLDQLLEKYKKLNRLQQRGVRIDLRQDIDSFASQSEEKLKEIKTSSQQNLTEYAPPMFGVGMPIAPRLTISPKNRAALDRFHEKLDDISTKVADRVLIGDEIGNATDDAFKLFLSETKLKENRKVSDKIGDLVRDFGEAEVKLADSLNKLQSVTSNNSDNVPRKVPALACQGLSQKDKPQNNAELDLLNAQARFKQLVEAQLSPQEKSLASIKEQFEIIEKSNASLEEQLALKGAILNKTIEESPALNLNFGSVLGSELIGIAEEEKKLNEWHQRQIELQKSRHDQKLIIEQDYLQKLGAINTEHFTKMKDVQDAYKSATLGLFSDVTGNIAEMFKETAGESSKAYKAMFLVSKAASIAQAIVNTEVAATRALEVGGHAGMVMSNIVRGMGYASVGLIASQTIAGIAHGGLDYVPNESTYLLQKGERVLSPKQNQDFTDFIQKNQSKNGQNIVVNVPVSVGSGNATVNEAKQLAAVVESVVKNRLTIETRPGGLLNRR